MILNHSKTIRNVIFCVLYVNEINCIGIPTYMSTECSIRVVR